MHIAAPVISGKSRIQDGGAHTWCPVNCNRQIYRWPFLVMIPPTHGSLILPCSAHLPPAKLWIYAQVHSALLWPWWWWWWWWWRWLLLWASVHDLYLTETGVCERAITLHSTTTATCDATVNSHLRNTHDSHLPDTHVTHSHIFLFSLSTPCQ